MDAWFVFLSADLRREVSPHTWGSAQRDDRPAVRARPLHQWPAELEIPPRQRELWPRPPVGGPGEPARSAQQDPHIPRCSARGVQEERRWGDQGKTQTDTGLWIFIYNSLHLSSRPSFSVSDGKLQLHLWHKINFLNILYGLCISGVSVGPWWNITHFVFPDKPPNIFWYELLQKG